MKLEVLSWANTCPRLGKPKKSIFKYQICVCVIYFIKFYYLATLVICIYIIFCYYKLLPSVGRMLPTVGRSKFSKIKYKFHILAT